MSDEIKINRTPSQPQARAEYVQPATQEPREAVSSTKSSKLPWIILGLVVLILVVCGIVFRDKLFAKKSSNAPVVSKVSDYQAVFLTNGQVYFGKLSDADKDYIKLADIYYLQVVQPPLQGQQQPGQATPQQQISLVKLGQELHGPSDEMHINRTQVLFYEDLKTDGKVVQAIQQYKLDPNAASVPTK